MKHTIAILLFLVLPLMSIAQIQLADDCYNKGVELYNAGKFVNAIEYFEKCDSLDKVQLDSTSQQRNRAQIAISYCLLDYAAQFCHRYGYVDAAIRYATQAMEIRKDVYGEEHSLYVVALNNIAFYYSELGNYQEAIKYETIAMNINRKVHGEEHQDYALSLHNVATYNYNIGNYKEAIKYGTLAMQIRKAVFGDESLEYLSSLTTLTTWYYSISNYSEAIKLGTLASQILKKQFGETHSEYIESLSELAMYNACDGNYSEAIRLESNVAAIYSKTLGKKHIAYGNSLNHLARYNSLADNYSDAVVLENKVRKIFKKRYGKDDLQYALSLKDLSLYYAAAGNYKKSFKYRDKSRVTGFISEYTVFPGFEYALENYLKNGHYDKVIKFGTKLLKIMSQNKVKGRLFSEELVYHSLQLPQGTQGPQAKLQSYLANAFYQQGKTQKAVSLETQAYYGDDRSYDYHNYQYSPYYILSEHFYPNLYKRNYDKIDSSTYQYAQKLFQGFSNNAINVDQLTFLDASKLRSLAFMNFSGDDTKSIDINAVALEVYKHWEGEAGEHYCESLIDQAFFYAAIGNFTEAINCASKALDIYQLKGKRNPLLLGNLIIYNYRAGNDLATAEMIKQVREDGLSVREDGDIPYVADVSYLYSLLFYAYCLSDTKILNSIAYNDQLERSLSLNALEIQKIIANTSDTVLVNRYNHICNNRIILDNLYQQPINERKINADSLSKVNDVEEHLLFANYTEFSDYIRDVRIEWQDVQNKLTSADIAIEFVQFFDLDPGHPWFLYSDYMKPLVYDDDKPIDSEVFDDDFSYIDDIYTLFPEYKNPKVFEDDKKYKKPIYIALILKKGMKTPELVKLDYSETESGADYTTPTLYNAIWKPLDKYLQGVKNVYFSPSGKFLTTAIEYLPDENGEIFAQKYNAYRLSSTRELALTHKPNANKKAAVYGGIRYDLGKEDWNDRKNNEYKDYVAELSAFRDEPIIDDQNLRLGVQYLKGTELEAKAIIPILRENGYQVSENTDIFATEESFKELSGSGIKILHIATHGFFQPSIPAGKDFTEDIKSLSKSGLLLAGANSALDPERRNDIPEGMDDGILTAKEISHLDFTGLDLVVLSACQTGLGTWEGLQHGFKKAGANTIVMSLWEVDDNATQLLMTEFFKNLTSGKTKREAFLKAQNAVKEKYPNPRYWAAFVMVDGVE